MVAAGAPSAVLARKSSSSANTSNNELFRLNEQMLRLAAIPPRWAAPPRSSRLVDESCTLSDEQHQAFCRASGGPDSGVGVAAVGRNAPAPAGSSASPGTTVFSVPIMVGEVVSCSTGSCMGAQQHHDDAVLPAPDSFC